jgi:hypothetical protein
MRRIFVLIALITAGSSAAFSQQRTMNHRRVAPTEPCHGAALSVRHVSEDAAMGGHNTIDYAFKNKSGSACTLKGYPRFELLDKSGAVRPHGRAINSQQLPGDEVKQPPQLVTIEPGKEAGFRVYYNSGGAGHVGKPCPVSRKVRITPPGTTRRFILPESITSCGELQVSTVRSELSQ